MKFYVFKEPIYQDKSIIDIFALYKDEPYSLLFDSASLNHPDSQYSFIAFHPAEMIEAKDGVISITNKDEISSQKGNPFDILHQRLTLRFGRPHNPQQKRLPPFQGGAAGYFGYDLARQLETLPEYSKDRDNLPDMAIGLYDRVLAYDHDRDQFVFMVHAHTEIKAKKIFQSLKDRIQAAPHPQNYAGKNFYTSQILEFKSTHSETAYKNAVQKIIDYIYAGDIFQANMSQRFEAPLKLNKTSEENTFDSFAHYCLLRDISPAPFASFMNFGNFQIASNSPERFLSVHDRHVETKPIKGTRPRGLTAEDDQKQMDLLTASSKDNAENAMIVDLLRNDLSRSCADYSIHVPKLFDIESFANVHHLVSTITGTIRADQTTIDLLKNCFPGGSITGAPKVRAMEIIEELETYQRGPYCGAIGYITPYERMDTNIAIRTLVYAKNHVSFNVGGGIVADSDPDAEYQETLDKAASILKSFQIFTSREEQKEDNITPLMEVHK